MPKLGTPTDPKQPDSKQPDPPATASVEPQSTDRPEQPPAPVPLIPPRTLGTLLDEAPDYVNALLYGREGTGKTTAAAFMANIPAPPGIPSDSLPGSGGRVLYVNAESGVKAKPLAALGVDTSRISVWPPPGVKLGFNTLEKLFLQMAEDLRTAPGCWTGVVFDSVTEIYQALLEAVTVRGVAKAAEKGRDRDRFETELGDYGIMTNQMRTLLRRFRDLPCHFACTALQNESEDEATGRSMAGPALPNQLAKSIMGYVDLVINLQSDQMLTDPTSSSEGSGEGSSDDPVPIQVITGYTRSTPKTRAKDRYGMLPPVLFYPTFDRIHAYIDGTLTPGTDQVQRSTLQLRSRHHELKLAARTRAK